MKKKSTVSYTCTYTIVASFENDMILSTVTKKSLTTSIPFISLKVKSRQLGLDKSIIVHVLM